MKKALPIALSLLVFNAGISLAMPPDAVATHDAGRIDACTLGTLSETDIDSVTGARTVCSGDLFMAQSHLAAGNLGQAAFWLLVAHLRPALCS